MTLVLPRNEIITHKETVVRAITGPNFPKQHTRRYVERTSNDSANLPESDNSNAKWPATSLFGPAPEPDIDAIAELVFYDEAGCKKFFEIIKQEDAQRKLAADEELFLDRGKLKAVVLGDVIVNHM